MRFNNLKDFYFAYGIIEFSHRIFILNQKSTQVLIKIINLQLNLKKIIMLIWYQKRYKISKKKFNQILK